LVDTRCAADGGVLPQRPLAKEVVIENRSEKVLLSGEISQATPDREREEGAKSGIDRLADRGNDYLTYPGIKSLKVDS